MYSPGCVPKLMEQLIKDKNITRKYLQEFFADGRLYNGVLRERAGIDLVQLSTVEKLHGYEMFTHQCKVIQNKRYRGVMKQIYDSLKVVA